MIPSGSPTYSDFQTFANGTYKGRGFQFRAKLTSNDTAQDIRVSQLGYTASLQRRTEQGNLTASGAGAKAVTLHSSVLHWNVSIIRSKFQSTLYWYQCSEYGIRRLL